MSWQACEIQAGQGQQSVLEVLVKRNDISAIKNIIWTNIQCVYHIYGYRSPCVYQVGLITHSEIDFSERRQCKQRQPLPIIPPASSDCFRFMVVITFKASWLNLPIPHTIVSYKSSWKMILIKAFQNSPEQGSFRYLFERKNKIKQNKRTGNSDREEQGDER